MATRRREGAIRDPLRLRFTSTACVSVVLLLLAGCHGESEEPSPRGSGATSIEPEGTVAVRPADGVSNAVQPDRESGRRAAFHKGKLLVREDFDRDLSRWRVEKRDADTVSLGTNKLRIDAGAGVTVWLRTRLDAPVMIQYEVKVIDRGGPHDRVSDVDCFWMAQDPSHPDDLFGGSEGRNGSVRAYDPLRLYYVGYGSNGNTTTRFRRHPGDGSRPLLPEHDLRSEEFLLTANHWIRFELVVFGDRVQFRRDGEIVFDVHDPAPFHRGWFALRTVNNHMAVDNLRVWRLEPGPGPGK